MNTQTKIIGSLTGKGKGVKFNRVRRITGYLVGDLRRWNSAKQAEEHDRVKHKIDVENDNKSDSKTVNGTVKIAARPFVRRVVRNCGCG